MNGYWEEIARAPEGVELLTRVEDERGIRNEQRLVKRDGLWWLADGSMHVYYTPTHYWVG